VARANTSAARHPIPSSHYGRPSSAEKLAGPIVRQGDFPAAQRKYFRRCCPSRAESGPAANVSGLASALTTVNLCWLSQFEDHGSRHIELQKNDFVGWRRNLAKTPEWQSYDIEHLLSGCSVTRKLR
jgi:hypothetical protein